jgi:tRNA 2-thiouridine synthesizing protein A
MADATVDARGLQCPMPVIKTSQAMAGLSPGQTLEVIASDRGALSDIPAWAKDMGYTVADQFEADSVFHFVIQKA